MYSIRAVSLDDDLFAHDLTGADPTALAAAAAGMNVSPGGSIHGLGSYMDQSAATAAAAAAAASVDYGKKQIAEVSKAHRIAKDAEKALEHERRENKMREQRRLTQERKEQKARDREALAVRKAHERAAREASREEKKRKRSEIRVTRERFVLVRLSDVFILCHVIRVSKLRPQQQKEAALQRAAELVASNRVPIEITRGAAAAKAAANAALVAGGAEPEVTQEAKKRGRSAIIVSTASDLHRIVTHSKNLWAKYNAIAREHNQKVSWATVAKELGIHVKVREKYSRMHSRAVQRGFDWIANGDWKIKDHPEIFMEPTAAEQKARMPLPPPDESTTVLIDGDSKEVTDEAVAAAAAAVRIVDASVVGDAHVDEVVHTTEEQTAAAAAVAATFVSDPTVKFDSTLSLDV